MRDAIRDQRYVRCPNASTLAYGRYRAHVGSWVVARQPGYTLDGAPINAIVIVGRMISRIVYSAGFPAGTNHEGAPTIRNWIEILALHEDMHHASIRWIDPATVVQVHPTAPDLAKFLEWFATFDPTHGKDSTIRGLAEYGCLSPNQAPDQLTWNFEHRYANGLEYVERCRVNGKRF